MLIPNPDLEFWNFNPKIHFWANFGQKSQSCLFCLKIGTHGILRMLILIPTLIFWISNPYFIFGQIWAKKVKVVCFNWKLAHTRKTQSCPVCLKIGTQSVSTMLILISTLLFSISNPKSFFGQVWVKKLEFSSLPGSWYTEHLEDVIVRI